MEREEMLQKLHGIKFSAQPTVVTMDMGLEYEYASKDGWGSSFGNMGAWPAYKIMGVTADQFNAIQKKVTENRLQVEDLENTPFLTFYNCIFSVWRPDEYVPTISAFFSNLEALKLPQDGSLYALCDSRAWEPSALFFGSYEEMEQEFCDEYASYIEPWEELDDEDLQKWVEKVDNELLGIPLQECEA